MNNKKLNQLGYEYDFWLGQLITAFQFAWHEVCITKDTKKIKEHIEVAYSDMKILEDIFNKAMEEI